MNWKSGRDMRELTRCHSGDALYLSNSASQSASLRGAVSPANFQSVMERPERVRRVTPPSTTIEKTQAAPPASQAPTARCAAGELTSGWLNCAAAAVPEWQARVAGRGRTPRGTADTPLHSARRARLAPSSAARAAAAEEDGAKASGAKRQRDTSPTARAAAGRLARSPAAARRPNARDMGREVSGVLRFSFILAFALFRTVFD